MEGKIIKTWIKTTVLALMVLLLSGCSTPQTDRHTIPYPEGYDTKSAGAAAADDQGDHAGSPYFKHPDVYNMENTDTLTVLSHFKTYQQTTENHCGPAAALMVLNHFGKADADELSIGEVMKTHQDINGDNAEQPAVANQRGEFGTSTDRMVQYFDSIGWEATSSLSEGKLENGATFDDFEKFREWVGENLRNNTPIMVEWIDWWGHWQDIIGYDTMGTEWPGDDVLILADPYDISDHCQDGYYLFSAVRFYYMWGDAGILPEDQSVQQWVIAKPKA